MPNGSWVLVRQLRCFSPTTFMEKTIFSHTAEETSIQPLVFFSIHFFFIFSFCWSSPELHSTTLTKDFCGDKITLTSPAIFLTNKIMRLSNYYFGVYSLTYVTTNHGNERITEKLLTI